MLRCPFANKLSCIGEDSHDAFPVFLGADDAQLSLRLGLGGRLHIQLHEVFNPSGRLLHALQRHPPRFYSACNGFDRYVLQFFGVTDQEQVHPGL